MSGRLRALGVGAGLLVAAVAAWLYGDGGPSIPAAVPSPTARLQQPDHPSERLGPLDGAHLTATVDAFLYLQKSASPLSRGQRERTVAMVREYLASCDVAEQATARFNQILTPGQLARLKSYPGGVAVDLTAPDVLVGRVLQLLEAHRPSGTPSSGVPAPQDFDQSPKMIRILEGLYQMLQDPSNDLSAAQAREAHRALEGTRDALVRMREVDVGMREILTLEQIRLLPGDIGGAEHDRSVLRALEAWLADGEGTPGIRGWVAPPRRQPLNWSLMALSTGLVVLEQDQHLRLSAEQRGRLLAQVRESLRAVEAVVAASHRCLGALTPDQWKAIYSSPVEEVFFGNFEFRHPQDAVEWLIEAYSRRAAPEGVEPGPVEERRFDHTTPPFIRMLEGLNYLERKEESPYRPTASQARILHDALRGIREQSKIYWETNPRLFALLTPEQNRYLREADIELEHEQNYVATLLLMLHLERD